MIPCSRRRLLRVLPIASRLRLIDVMTTVLSAVQALPIAHSNDFFKQDIL